jgi:prepilin-type N-terminal cleavage/methylation domain-containing protein
MKKGFTLVELSIVLIIMGLLTGGAFQLLKVMNEKARATEAKNTLEAAKQAVMGFVLNSNRLPTQLEFTNMNLLGTGNTPIFYNSDNARQVNNGLCGVTTTPLNTTDANAVNTQNIGFVLAVAGENMIIQTSRVGNNVTFPLWNTLVGGRGYDDFHTQVTLADLQTAVKCEPLKIINPTIHDGILGQPYSVTFVASGGDGNYAYARTGGAFPAGFNLTPGGVLTGATPAINGTSIFTITVTSDTKTSSRQYTLVY